MRPYGLGNWEEISAISRSSDLYNLEIARSQWYLHSQNELSHLEIQSGTFRTLNFALVCIRKFKVEVPVDVSLCAISVCVCVVCVCARKWKEDSA